MADKLKLVFLGTSGAVPSAKRNHTSIFLSYKDENILIDCGEGTQRQFRKARLNSCKITKILITHWHGDHVLGIPGLMQTLAFSHYNKKLLIYSPIGTKKFLKNMLNTFSFDGKLDFEVFEVDGKFFETEDFFLESKKMTHGIVCNAYSFVVKERLRIDKKKLEKHKIKVGPHLLKLKQGKNIVYEGKKYSPKDLTYFEEGKKISFVFDTSMNKSIVPFVKDSDVLVCEATFDKDSEKIAKEYGHLSVDQTAKIAKDSKSKKLFLTHISQRYGKNSKIILKQAKEIFKNSFLPDDLDSFEL